VPVPPGERSSWPAEKTWTFLYRARRDQGGVPFMVAQIVVLALLVVFHQVVMWPLQMMSR
jgi:TRAP-type mannitol/chloroaromatic compound transport system permease large subunit